MAKLSFRFQNPQWSWKKLQKKMAYLASPLAIGFYISLLYVFLAHNFYKIRSYTQRGEVEEGQIAQLAYEIVELLDLKSRDFLFRSRGIQNPEARVALLTIDDRSIEEVGRWPWSREVTAQVVAETMRYGAKAIGFDIVFSEPQVNPTLAALDQIESHITRMPADVQSAFNSVRSQGHPDKIFADVISSHHDRLILGAFNDDAPIHYRAFQDYCRNEAFHRANSSQFVKLNATFMVNDEADYFVDLPFREAFDQIFPVLEKITGEESLSKVFRKTDLNSLTPQEKKQLQYLQEQARFNYCNQWLTKEDPYLDPLKDVYSKIFSNSDRLKGLDFSLALETFKSQVKSHPITQQNRWTINTEALQSSSDYTASFNAEQDSDGSIRRASMFFRTGNRIGLSFIPSLALQTFLVASGYQARIELNEDPKNQSQKAITKFDIFDTSKDPEELYTSVPVDAQGRMKINYAGGTNTFPYLPAKEMLNGRPTATITQREYNADLGAWVLRETEVQKADFIKDRTFIFGATAMGVYDLRVTPFEKNFPGPETHLNTLANLFQKNFLYTYPNEHLIMLWALILFGILLAILISRSGSVAGFLITLISLSGLTYLDFFLFRKNHTVTMVLPVLLICSMYLFMTLYKYFTEERKKQHLRSTFSKYVSPAIVDEILKDPENINLGGIKQRMSVFFSDVRGFTEISEKLDPQVLSDVLNRYLTPMTQIVFANRGTLDKYMGDAVMAFFGAPIGFSDHAVHACRCALQSLEKLQDIQKEFEVQNLPRIDIGIGINSAEMSVGNMGSDIVRNYTVMGDAVNLGSRLEGINKQYGTRIIISEFTYQDIKDLFTAREIDWVRVKGKHLPVRIFELINEGPPKPEWVETLVHFQKGFQCYHNRQFKEAKAAFDQALATRPIDPVSKLYIERCEDYLETPPPENWDGVHVMKTK